MKLTLIKPNIGRREHSLYVDEGRMEPLQLGVLAGMTPQDIEVALIDDRCEDIDYDSPTDLVAITVETFTARRAYEISAEFRKRGTQVVIGGIHPTLLPVEAKLHADSIIIGDAEMVWDRVMADAKKGKIKPVYKARMGIPQSGIIPRRDIFKGKGYLPLTLIQFGRGCRNSCTFCAISAYFKQKYRYRPINEVVDEIEHQERKIFFFVDDNIVADRDATKRLLRALIPLRINWVGQGSIDMARDGELMELMAASGCLGNVIGFESINPEVLRTMKKMPNLADFNVYEHEIEILKSYGLQTWAAFVLGVDGDTPDELYKVYDFALRHRFTFAAFNVLMPYPGTPLYGKLRSEGRLLYGGRWWLHPDYRFNHAAFKPARMTADELTQISYDIRYKWNSFGTILKRSLDLTTNMRTLMKLALYWRYNVLFRKETLKKQGMRFGRL